MDPAPVPLWPPLPGAVLPAEGEVLLACAPLDLPEAQVAALRATFPPEEQQRADRFATGRLRSRWTAGRGLLRALLARATGGEAAALRFTYAAHGKPALDPRSAPALVGAPLTFNVSHSHGLGLYALARGVEVGVDVERVQARRSDDLADRFFHADESAWLRLLPDGPREQAFFALWCAKEAFIKANGAGLSQSLSSFCLALGEGGPAGIAWHQGDPRAHERWSVHRLEPAAGFRGALVAEGQGLRLRLHGWSPGA